MTKTGQELSPSAKDARNAYRRKWYAENKEKHKEYVRRYWEHKAAQTDSDGKISEENGKGDE
ncbi:MAG: hypothetical protein IJL23_03000 [Alphaproteobacteria bacterium]|jgi:hypothetical protein|nr:hypothetical protein [Alphaproteobacteria bacterium]